MTEDGRRKLEDCAGVLCCLYVDCAWPQPRENRKPQTTTKVSGGKSQDTMYLRTCKSTKSIENVNIELYTLRSLCCVMTMLCNPELGSNYSLHLAKQ